MSNQEEIFGVDYQDMHNVNEHIIESDRSSENSEVSPNVIEILNDNIAAEEPIELPEQLSNDNVEITETLVEMADDVREEDEHTNKTIETPIEEENEEHVEPIEVPKILLENSVDPEETPINPTETVEPDTLSHWKIQKEEHDALIVNDTKVEEKNEDIKQPECISTTNERLSLLVSNSETLEKKAEVEQVLKKSLCLSDIYARLKEFFYGVK